MRCVGCRSCRARIDFIRNSVVFEVDLLESLEDVESRHLVLDQVKVQLGE